MQSIRVPRGHAGSGWLVLVALWALLSSSWTGAEPLQVRMAALPGVAGAVGAPATIRVDLRFDGERFRGWLEVRRFAPYERPVLRREVDIGRGAYSFYLYPTLVHTHAGPTTNVQVLDAAGRIIHMQDLPIATRHHVVLCIMPGMEMGTHEAPVALPAVQAPHSSESLAPVYQQQLLPDRWYGLMPFAGVYWHHQAEPQLSGAQRIALRQWVQQGGTLYLEHRGLFLLDQLEVAPEVKLAALRLREMPADVVPFQIGAGRLLILPDGAALPLDSEVLSREVRRSIDQRTLAKSFANADLHVGVEALLRPAVMLGLFILLATLGEWLLLRKLRRRQFTWVTFPLTVLAFSLIAFFFFNRSDLAGRRTELVLEERSANGVGGVLNRVVAMRQASSGRTRLALEQQALVQLPSQTNYHFMDYAYQHTETIEANGARYLDLFSLRGQRLDFNVRTLLMQPSPLPSLAAQLQPGELEGQALTLPESLHQVAVQTRTAFYDGGSGQLLPVFTRFNYGVGTPTFMRLTKRLPEAQKYGLHEFVGREAIIAIYRMPGQPESWRMVLEPLPEGTR